MVWLNRHTCCESGYFLFPTSYLLLLTELLRLALRMEEYGDGSSFGDVAAGDRVGMAFDAATGSSAG